MIDKKTIAQICQFNLETNKTISENLNNDRGPVRMNVKSFAITCWTNVSSKTFRGNKKRRFLKKINYFLFEYLTYIFI